MSDPLRSFYEYVKKEIGKFKIAWNQLEPEKYSILLPWRSLKINLYPSTKRCIVLALIDSHTGVEPNASSEHQRISR